LNRVDKREVLMLGLPKMKFAPRCPCRSVLLLGLLTLTPAPASSQEPSVHAVRFAVEGGRVVTEADSIAMTTFGNESYLNGASFKHEIANFSPDGQRFVVVLKKGSLSNNTNEYWVDLYRTSEAFIDPKPVVLASFSSSSNRPGIDNVRWLDNHIITFLAENPGETHQLYSLDVDRRRVKKLTRHSESVDDYALKANGGPVFFTADVAPKTLLDEDALRHGIVVKDQNPAELFKLENTRAAQFRDVFMHLGGQEHIFRIQGSNVLSGHMLWISPDARFLIVNSLLHDIPERWNEYNEPDLTSHLRAKFALEFQRIDIRTGEVLPLLDAPNQDADVASCGDGQSIIVAGAFLPLNVSDSEQRKARQSNPFVVEVNVETGEIVAITAGNYKLREWACHRNRLFLESRDSPEGADLEGQRVVFEKTATGWARVSAILSTSVGNEPIDVSLEEDMNTPPKIFVTDAHSGKRILLLDLNPEFQQFRFGHVQQVKFRATDGHEVTAGVYLPPNYVKGKKYPLVIQTHGWNPERFWIDGPYTTAFAAQALAAKDIVVIQMPQGSTDAGTPKEAKYETAAFEGAINYLDSTGLVDRDRVGIVGFSHTHFIVYYALTHSSYRFAAAAAADGLNGGYYTYVAFFNSPAVQSYYEGVNGGIPFGRGLASWLELSPGFNLDRVNTPVRIEDNGPSVWADREWLAGLTRLHKAVEQIYIPDAAHVLVKPWNRMTSQDGDVDWFCFWLKGEEDPNPAKAEQYGRWRELRKVQEQNEKKSAPAN